MNPIELSSELQHRPEQIWPPFLFLLFFVTEALFSFFLLSSTGRWLPGCTILAAESIRTGFAFFSQYGTGTIS
jgi:hypothetical protein